MTMKEIPFRKLRAAGRTEPTCYAVLTAKLGRRTIKKKRRGQAVRIRTDGEKVGSGPFQEESGGMKREE